MGEPRPSLCLIRPLPALAAQNGASRAPTLRPSRSPTARAAQRWASRDPTLRPSRSPTVHETQKQAGYGSALRQSPEISISRPFAPSKPPLFSRETRNQAPHDRCCLSETRKQPLRRGHCRPDAKKLRPRDFFRPAAAHFLIFFFSILLLFFYPSPVFSFAVSRYAALQRLFLTTYSAARPVARRSRSRGASACRSCRWRCG